MQGTEQDLKRPDAVIMDEIYKQKLGVEPGGRVVRDRRHRARIVVGFTHGIRSFTTSPYVFTTFKNAQDFTQCSGRPDDLHTGEAGAGR